MSPDLGALTSDDLLYAAVREADDGRYLAVAQVGMRGPNRRVAGVLRVPVAIGGSAECSLVIGHVEKCTENLTTV